ncbi:MAG: hypothetical protein HOY71_20215, partial [Nonomuraea sp.]|nr:hypothetical protein [Nonomuraea sp.]
TTGPAGSWPAFEPVQPQARNSYEVRSGWAVADDSDPLTGPSPAAGTPTAPSRAVSAYDDVLSGPAPTQPPSVAYETGDFASPAAAWPEPPAANSSWPSYNEMYGRQNEPTAAPQGSGGRGGHRRAPEQQDYPDYYR